MLSERSLLQKALHYMILFIWHSGEDKNIGKEIRLVIAQGLGTGGREVLGMIQMFCILIVVEVI